MTGFPLPTIPLSFTAENYLLADLDALSLDGDTSLYRYSYLTAFNLALTNPGALGLPSLSPISNCVADSAQATGCAGYLFFDAVHPTSQVHEAIARDMDRQFSLVAVPEPATWLMLVSGFALAGGALRGRRNRTARLAFN